ncbi:MAG TPA: Smr/MutS family protein [Kiloniellales bacterium]|nr:Smr/MutS family protein [Kiloniellales bacterium]
MEEPRHRHQGKRPSEEDLQLWRHMTRGIKPLKAEGFVPEAEGSLRPKEVPREPTSPKVQRDARVRAVAPPKAIPGRLPAPHLEQGDLRALDKRKSQRLRRGRLPIEARLDLHGMTQEDAHFALRRFVLQSAILGRRCVLVITGKGGRHGAAGVLRRQVPHWLNAADLRDKLLGFDHARPEHGGAGALYLLLRRQRDRQAR